MTCWPLESLRFHDEATREDLARIGNECTAQCAREVLESIEAGDSEAKASEDSALRFASRSTCSTECSGSELRDRILFTASSAADRIVVS